MKKLQIFLFAILFITTGFTVGAYAQTTKGTLHIQINAKGGIHDHAGTQLGYIDKDDVVRNSKGKKLYFIDKNGNVIDANGKKLGMAKKNGSYYNVNGETILTTKDLAKEKCAILDPQGHTVGIVHKNYKLHACAAHCFFLEQAKQKAEKKS